MKFEQRPVFKIPAAGMIDSGESSPSRRAWAPVSYRGKSALAIIR